MVPEPTLGELLRRYRRTAGLTQEELAEQSGLSVRAISDMERGAPHVPRRETVDLLVQALRLTDSQRATMVDAAQRLRLASPRPLWRISTVSVTARHELIPLSGRAQEMSALMRHLTEDAPPVLMLAGEPGIGKTRLLHEAAELAHGKGMNVLLGGCQRRSVQEPYAPLSELLARCVEALPTERRRGTLEGCGWLVRLLPELSSFNPGPATPGAIPPEQERRLVFEAVGRFLATFAETSELLVVLDDLQWAGPDTMDLVTALLHNPRLATLRVVAAYRDSEVRSDDPLAVTLADLLAAGLAQQLKIGPLTEPAARQLLTSLMEEAYTGALADRVIQATGRVPFFLVRYAHDLRSPEGGSPAASDVPWDVSYSIQQRVSTLPPLGQDLVRMASVVGRVVPRALLTALAKRPESDVLAPLERVCQARLLEELGPFDYQFAHDVIREVVEESLGAARRVVLHRHIAEALANMPGARAEDLAYHYARSDQPAKALPYLIQAADRAHAAAAPREEAVLLGQAAHLALATGQPEMVADVRARSGRAFFIAAMWHDAEDAYLAALPGLTAEQRIRVLTDLAVLRHWLLDVPSTRRYAAEALTLAEELGRDDLAAAATVALALASSSDGELRASVEQYRRAYVRNGRKHILLPSAGAELCGLVLYWLGDFDAAIELNREAIDAASSMYDMTTVARALGNLGMSLVGKGWYAQADQTFVKARKFAREHQLTTWLARATAMHGGLHLELFDFDTAEALAEEARDISRSANWRLATISGGIDLLLNFARRGDLGRVEGLVDEVAEGVASGQGAHGWLWRLRFAQTQAEIALARGDYHEALQPADHVIAESRRLGRIKYEVAGLQARARALAGLGREHEAIADLESAVERARKTGDPAMFLRAAAALLELDGNDSLVAEALATVDHVVAAIPESRVVARFREAGPVRLIAGSS